MHDLKEAKTGKDGVKWSDGTFASQGILVATIDDIFRLITLNAMKASEEITEEQSRQVRYFPRRFEY